MKFKALIKIFFVFLLCSCNEKELDNFNCNVNITFDNVIVKNSEIYVTQDYSLKVESIDFIYYNNKRYDIIVDYFIDSMLYIRSEFPPYKIKFNLTNFDNGLHLLTVKIHIVDNENELLTYDKNYKFKLIETSGEINEFEVGTYFDKFKINEYITF